MSTRRDYSSTLREEHARQTRLRIRRAARELFAEQGFTATTVAAIARRAGVSAATVYAAFESKAGIVAATIDEMEHAVDMETRIGAMLAETDPFAQLRLWVEAHCALFATGTDVLRAAMQAQGAPEVRALIERGDGNRRAACARLSGIWERSGALREGLDAAGARDRLFLLSTVDSFLTATGALGWAVEAYAAWLLEVAAAQVLREAPV